MRIARNRSGRSTKELRSLLKFVAARCKRSYMADYQFDKASANMSALTDNPGGTAPSLVHIYLTEKPLRASWQEDAVYALAICMRKLDNAWTIPYANLAAENTDANQFAQETLALYREACRVCMPD